MALGIYQTINTTDDVVGPDLQIISQPIWSQDMNPWTTAWATGIGWYTSSAQLSQSGDYLVNIYHKNPQSDSTAAIQLAIAYGHRGGSGSVGDANTVGNNANDTPSRAIYSQYANTLLDPADRIFTFGTVDSSEILVLNVARARFRQKIDPGNWELRLGSGSGANMTGSGTKYSTFIDDSGAGENPQVGASGRVFGIYSGSGGVTQSNTQYGLFYPDQGIFVFHAGLLRSNLGHPYNTASAVQARNHVTMSLALSGSNYFAARSEEKITSTHYFIRIKNMDNNFTNNPTFTTGSNGVFKHSSMINNPSVYITTIGMYNTANELVAVAKLSKPLLKSFNREALIKVKLDY